MDWMPPANAEPKPGQFLLSEPFLDDPWFGRKVVFLCDHDEQGSLGFVLNNGMGRNLTSLLPDAEPWGLDHEVHRGGPVHADSLFCLHRLGDGIEGSLPVLPGLPDKVVPRRFRGALSNPGVAPRRHLVEEVLRSHLIILICFLIRRPLLGVSPS